jgi:uncharacterized protein (TIGR00251 family)
MLRIESTAENRAVLFSVRVQPGASSDEIVGEMGGALKIRLRAPAVEDRANEALIEYLAQTLNTSKAAVRILSGARSRTKRMEVRGVSADQVQQLLIREA